jgi:hypothetical protein
MTLVPEHNMAGYTPQDSYGSVLFAFPATASPPGNVGILEVTSKVLGSGDGVHSTVGISQNALTILDGGSLLGQNSAPLAGFTIDGSVNAILHSRDVAPVSMIPGELVQVGNILYYVDDTDSIASLDLSTSGGTIVEIEDLTFRRVAGGTIYLQGEAEIGNIAPGTADLPEGYLWFDSTTSPYQLKYLDKSGAPSWLPVTGEDVTSHAALSGAGGHIPTGGFVPSDVGLTIVQADIGDLDTSTFVDAPVVDDIVPPLVADVTSPWLKSKEVYWYSDSNYRSGIRDIVRDITPDGADTAMLALSSEYKYNIVSFHVMYDVEDPNLTTTFFDGSNYLTVEIFTADGPLHSVIISDPAESIVEVFPIQAILDPIVTNYGAIYARATVTGNIPSVKYLTLQLSYERTA